MSFIPFPNVPNVLGVPSIPRSSSANPIISSALGMLQGAILRSFTVDTRWGVFDKNGKALGDPSKFTGVTNSILESVGIGSLLSFDSIGYSKETKISDFPIESGSFASYNKVEMPATPSVILCMQGSESNRTEFLTAIDEACKSTDVYNVVTPEITYAGYSIEKYTYHRGSSSGVTLMIVEITLKEIREVSALYTSSLSEITASKDFGATNSVDNGTVQTKAPSQSALKKLSNYFGGLK
jgi:hypothetical protein